MEGGARVFFGMIIDAAIALGVNQAMPYSTMRVLDSLEGMACATNPHEMAEAALQAFRQVVKGDYYAVGWRPGDISSTEAFHPGEGWLGPEAPLFRAFAKLASLGMDCGTHPVTLAFEKKQRPGAFLRSQLMPFHLWERTPHYQVVDRTLAVKDMTSIYLCPKPGQLIILNCGRKRTFQPETVEAAARLERVMTRLLHTRERDSLLEKIKDSEPSPSNLSKREREVLHWVREGKRNREIATILGLSPLTVRRHLENIFQKLGVETRSAAANAFDCARP